MTDFAAATRVLLRAVELDNKQRYKEALICYQEGTDLLMNVLKNEPDASKKRSIRVKLEEYLSRGEKIKPLVQNQSEKYHEKIEIKDGDTGYSYHRIFDKCLTGTGLSEVRVQDPYVRSHHQVLNFLHFCEMIVHVGTMKKITLVTGRHQDYEVQDDKFNKMADSLRHRGINLEIIYSDTLHDREIVFNNGWVVKIGRGLDFFKPIRHQLSVGHFDQTLRQCYETTVDLYKNN